jgi:hypothetical protein
MTENEIVKGVELYIPAGADLTHSRPYYLRVLEVYSPTNEYGDMMIRAEKIRADGTASKRRGRTVTIATHFHVASVRRR